MTERRVGESEDATLVRAVAHGSEEALAALYDRHVDGVHAVAFRLTRDRQVAEEVVQETFLALWNRAELFDPASGRWRPGCGRSPATGPSTGCAPRADAHRWSRSPVGRRRPDTGGVRPARARGIVVIGGADADRARGRRGRATCAPPSRRRSRDCPRRADRHPACLPRGADTGGDRRTAGVAARHGEDAHASGAGPCGRADRTGTGATPHAGRQQRTAMPSPEMDGDGTR